MIRKNKDYFRGFGGMSTKDEWRKLVSGYDTKVVRSMYMDSTIAFLNSAKEWRRDDMFGRNIR